MAKASGSHESFDRQDDTKMGSERGFALVFALFFGLVSLFSVWGGPSWAGLALAVIGTVLGARLPMVGGSLLGFLLAAACFAAGLWQSDPQAFAGWHWWWLAIGAAFAAIGLFAPALLRPLNWVWFKFGLLLHHIVGPLVMGLLFYLTVTPIALIMRALGKRPLALGFDPTADSYWIRRDPPGPPPESMTKQF